MCLDQTVVNIWRSSLCLLAQTHTHGQRKMEMGVTGQRRVKKRWGTCAKCLPGGIVGEPGGGARLFCFFRAPEDVLKQLLPLNGKIAHKSEWRQIENKSRERVFSREGRQVGGGDGWGEGQVGEIPEGDILENRRGGGGHLVYHATDNWNLFLGVNLMSYDQIGNVVQIQITTEKKVILGSDPAHMLNFSPERAQAFELRW